MRRDPWGDSFPGFPDFLTRLSRPRRRRSNFPHKSGIGPTFQTKAVAAHISRPRRRRRDQETVPRDHGGDGATFQTKANAARFSWPMGDGATFRPKGTWRDFSVQSSCGATFQTRGHAARLSRQGGSGATFQIKADAARLSVEDGGGATFQSFQILGWFSRPRQTRCEQEAFPCDLWWIRCEFPDKAEKAGPRKKFSLWFRYRFRESTVRKKTEKPKKKIEDRIEKVLFCGYELTDWYWVKNKKSQR